MKGKVKTMSKIQLRKQDSAVSVPSVSRLAGVMVCCVLGVLGSSGIALATPPAGFSSSIVGLATFDEIRVVNAGEAKVKITTQGDVDVYTLRNTFAPGGYIGWHTHPGPSLVTVVAGTATNHSRDDPTCR